MNKLKTIITLKADPYDCEGSDCPDLTMRVFNTTYDIKLGEGLEYNGTIVQVIKILDKPESFFFTKSAGIVFTDDPNRRKFDIPNIDNIFESYEDKERSENTA